MIEASSFSKPALPVLEIDIVLQTLKNVSHFVSPLMHISDGARSSLMNMTHAVTISQFNPLTMNVILAEGFLVTTSRCRCRVLSWCPAELVLKILMGPTSNYPPRSVSLQLYFFWSEPLLNFLIRCYLHLWDWSPDRNMCLTYFCNTFSTSTPKTLKSFIIQLMTSEIIIQQRVCEKITDLKYCVFQSILLVIGKWM